MFTYMILMFVCFPDFVRSDVPENLLVPEVSFVAMIDNIFNGINLYIICSV